MGIIPIAVRRRVERVKIKRRVFEIIGKAEPGNRASQGFDILIVSLILLSVVAIVLESFSALATRYAAAFNAFEAFTVAVFTVEYGLRIWTADLLYPRAKHPRLRYILSFMAMVDLLAILPFYLPFVAADFRFLRLLRMFRLSRMLRLLKLGRYIDSLQVIGAVIRNAAAQLVASIGACCLIVLISAILMYGVENSSQPEKFPNIVAALWWAVCTLTTVGYGDVYPITALGKGLAAIISVMGIGIVAIPTGIISAGFTESMATRRKARATATQKHEEAQKSFCPYCGKRLE